jgi:hypothetical protein
MVRDCVNPTLMYIASAGGGTHVGPFAAQLLAQSDDTIHSCISYNLAHKASRKATPSSARLEHRAFARISKAVSCL